MAETYEEFVRQLLHTAVSHGEKPVLARENQLSQS